jgi:hypothetical protein
VAAHPSRRAQTRPPQDEGGERRVTPAMAAGVTGKLWEISDVVAMLEKWEAAN